MLRPEGGLSNDYHEVPVPVPVQTPSKNYACAPFGVSVYDATIKIYNGTDRNRLDCAHVVASMA